MRYRMLKSGKHLLQNVVFGGVVFVLLGTLQASDYNTATLATNPMPQPDANIILAVAFSSPSGRMAVSAGPDHHDPTSLYVNSPGAPANFKVYWSPDTEVHGVGSMAWSHNEDALAFIGMSGSRTTKTGEVWLYTLDVASGKVRKVLKISETVLGEERRLVNADKDKDKTVLAWFGNNKVCMPTRDNSIIAVNSNDGHIETLVPAQDCKIWGPVSVSSDKLRFLKMRPSGQGWEIEVCEFDGSKVVSFGIIPITADKTAFATLSADGAYAFICMKEEPISLSPVDKMVIWNVSQMVLVKEIPLLAESDTEKYIYIPVTILKGEQLVLIEFIDDKDSMQLMSRNRLCTVKL